MIPWNGKIIGDNRLKRSFSIRNSPADVGDYFYTGQKSTIFCLGQNNRRTILEYIRHRLR